MIISTRTKLIFGAFTAFFAATSLFTLPTAAEENKKEGTEITMMPTRHNVSLEPGQTYKGEFTIINTGSTAFDYHISAVPYNVVGDDYKQVFDNPTDSTKISEWITFDRTSGTLEPHDGSDQDPDSRQVIKYTINVPEDAPGGGQYAAIAAEVDNNEEGMFQTVSRVAAVVYADVAGDTRREGSILENKVGGFYFNPPISATSLVENTGNVHADATYTFKVFPLFSSEEVYTNEEDPVVRTILPNTRRFNTQSWDGAPMLGIFNVEQTVEFLGKTSVQKSLVIICPLWLIFIIIFLILVIVFWLVSRARTRKSDRSEHHSRR